MVFLRLMEDTAPFFHLLPVACLGFLWLDFSPTCDLILQEDSECTELQDEHYFPMGANRESILPELIICWCICVACINCYS